MGLDNMQRKTPKQEYWGNHISFWRKSGLAQRQYCLSQGIAPSTFSYWIHKLSEEAESPGAARFYPLTVKSDSTSYGNDGFRTGVRLSLCNDKFKIDLEKEFSQTTLKRLLSTLETI